MTRLTIMFICLIATSLTLAGISDAKIDPKAVAGMWLFDEGSGKIAKDSSGNKNDGNLMGDPKWVDGEFGKALEFNGVGDYVDLPQLSS